MSKYFFNYYLFYTLPIVTLFNQLYFKIKLRETIEFYVTVHVNVRKHFV